MYIGHTARRRQRHQAPSTGRFMGGIGLGCTLGKGKVDSVISYIITARLYIRMERIVDYQRATRSVYLRLGIETFSSQEKDLSVAMRSIGGKLQHL